MNPRTETEQQGKGWIYLEGLRRMVAEADRNQERRAAAKLEPRREQRREIRLGQLTKRTGTEGG